MKKSVLPRKTGRVILVLEIEVDIADKPDWVRVTSSIPSRPSSFGRVWALSDGLMDIGTHDDVNVYVHEQIVSAVELVGGIQMVLPME